MFVKLNGEETEVEENITILDLLNQKSLPANTAVVEVNGSIIDPSNFSSVQVQDDDAIEVLRFVGGG